MSSAIDATKPGAAHAYTADMRANWAAAKAEIEALQALYSATAKQKVDDISIASILTLANEVDLYHLIGANEKWIIEWTLAIGAALATTGIQVAITTPSGAVQDIQATMHGDVETAANSNFKRTTVSGTALDFTAATQAGVGDAQLRIVASIQNGVTAGSAQLQWAQSTSSATDLTMRKLSMMRAMRVP